MTLGYHPDLNEPDFYMVPCEHDGCTCIVDAGPGTEGPYLCPAHREDS